ncbi:MAG: hypothetical protein M1826_006310 [Phylliscum demangeonii]|nr:MAG: hypothetical protein M1826_006310 [Phylliscum demangeonii]
MSRPVTPPPQQQQQPAPASSSSPSGSGPRPPLTPEQVRKIEINRLKAKELRDQRDQRDAAAAAAAPRRPGHGLAPTMPRTSRDGGAGSRGAAAGIQPAQKFARFVEYDFSKMTDTKAGFLTVEDDPHNKALHGGRGGRAAGPEKPAHMTLAEWERTRLLQTLRAQKAGPFEPALSVISGGAAGPGPKTCRECHSLEIDWKWEAELHCRVCNACKDKFPERYSLLTKTEARQDYLLTDPELRDPDLLPHLERPNPHKSSWNQMMLYPRYQLEAYAFSPKKWGSPEALDAEFARRAALHKARKERAFRVKLHDLRRRTRLDAHRRARRRRGDDDDDDDGDGGGDDDGGGGGELGRRHGSGFGSGSAKHQHVWGHPVQKAGADADADGDGMPVAVKRCVGCGMEVEELEF